MNNLVRAVLAVVLLSVPVLADQTRVVVFSRHTYRGVTPLAGNQPIVLPQIGLNGTLLMLGYAMEASPEGLVLAKRFAIQGLNQAARLAAGNAFAGWDEIRADLSTSRTFYTALMFCEGLQGSQTSPIELTGCPTVEGAGIDAVTLGRPIRACIVQGDLSALQTGSSNLKRLQAAGEKLLRIVGTATGKAGPYTLPPALDPATGKIAPIYAQVGNLASCLEMASDLGPPLKLLFPQAPDPSRYEREALRSASGYLGVRFTAQTPMELACACTVIPLQYLDSIRPGRHVIVLTHDNDLSTLIRALGMVSDEDVDALTIYPLESFVFAINSEKVSLVRLRLHFDGQGVASGAPQATLLWQGTRKAWDEKVHHVIAVASAWKAGAAERANVHLLPAQPLRVLMR